DLDIVAAEAAIDTLAVTLSLDLDCRTGVWPRGAHVRRTTGCCDTPLSSSKTIQACRRRAFFLPAARAAGPFSSAASSAMMGAKVARSSSRIVERDATRYYR